MMTFLNSNLFIGLATIFTGAGVYIIFLIQKRNSKIQAALVLLTEIRTAEEMIDQIRDKILDKTTIDLPSVLPTNSWKKYSHLFVGDFDQDELKHINSFYNYGELIGEFAQRNNNYLWIVTEERAKVMVNKIAELISDSFGTQTPDADIVNKRDYIIKGLDMYNLPYTPQKTLDGMKDYISKIQKITTSNSGLKLKKLANL